MVSVPWVITMPLYSIRFSKTWRAMVCHSSGWMLEESRWRISRIVMS
ncbi:Uncharacterised protein [Flavonifractor plautii]|uniref:Uncharacterized protein n=1 Tax=Flavonifractor plautii TaxID=292800 RepID=A0A174NY20_FLAPL|nr:Uncharacterised protein [Flavonifractor plautii]